MKPFAGSAPADPNSALTKVLKARASEHKDGQGYLVVHHGLLDEVHVRIPRCRVCQHRNEISAVLITAGCLVGGVLGAVEGGKGASIIFALLGGGMAYLGVSLWERPSLRPVSFYPPLRRLRQAGWKERSGSGAI